MTVREAAAAYGFNLRKWTVKEYYRAAETGVFKPEERLELIRGDVIQMSPQRGPHASAIDLVTEATRSCFPGARIRPQLPLSLDQFNEPEPDIVVARGPASRYFKRHPRSEDVLLVIEVSDSSIKVDRTVKAALYAEFGIPEYWILDLNRGRLEVHREPSQSPEGARYILAEVLDKGASVTALFGQSSLEVGKLLPE
jgi:Uma2 family endonuclease